MTLLVLINMKALYSILLSCNRDSVYYKVLLFYTVISNEYTFLFLYVIILILLFLFVISIFYIIPLTEDFCLLKIIRYVIS